MNKVKLFGVLGLIFFFVALPVSAKESFQFGLDFNMGFPQNAFNDHIDGDSLGGSAYFIFNIPRSPVYIGASFSILIYGSQTRSEPFSETIQEVYVDVTTRNSILLSHLFARVMPQKGRLRPYFEALVGFNYLWTETGVYDQSSNVEGRKIASNVNHDDFAFSYGAGCGVVFRLYSNRRNTFSVNLDTGIRYLRGKEAEYMTEDSIVRKNNNVEYFIHESKTDLVALRIGLCMGF
jgi:hypothetical protein